MSNTMKLGLCGFLFGTVGMYILAAGSLFSPVIESITGPLFWPGRMLASLIVGNTASDLAVGFLSLANGAFYGLVFIGIGRLFHKR
jgi:hypothetical protein